MSELVIVSHNFYKGERYFVPYLHLGDYFQHLLEGYIVKNPKKRKYYIIKIKSIEISVPFDEYQSLKYYECLLEKVRKKAITTRLKIFYEESKRTYIYEKGGSIDYWSVHLVMEGKKDEFIQQIYSEIQEMKQKCDLFRLPNF